MPRTRVGYGRGAAGIGAAQCPGAAHSFIVFLAEQFYPINVLNTIKLVPEGLPDILRHCESDRSRVGVEGDVVWCQVQRMALPRTSSRTAVDS